MTHTTTTNTDGTTITVDYDNYGNYQDKVTTVTINYDHRLPTETVSTMMVEPENKTLVQALENFKAQYGEHIEKLYPTKIITTETYHHGMKIRQMIEWVWAVDLKETN